MQKQRKLERKKVRIDIRNINDFVKAMRNEGYKIVDFEDLNSKDFKTQICNIFNIKDKISEKIYSSISNNEGKITYRAKNVKDFIDYMEKTTKIIEYEERLWKKICKINKIYIDRIEYERKPSVQEYVDHIMDAINHVKNNMCKKINVREKLKLYELKKGIDDNYIYAKDIELLKNMIIYDKGKIENTYDENTCTKRIYIEIPEKINSNYIKATEGSIEYYEHISRNIPRIKRLIKNINKYMKISIDEEGKTICEINQSNALQDSVNIAMAIYNEKEFKAVSGQYELDDYCIAMDKEDTAFESYKVNRLGEIGTGYDRFYDSEKKILERIHKQIEEKELDDKGRLVIYSRWEPCPSCYYVISQFCKAHPEIKVHIKFDKAYGK